MTRSRIVLALFAAALLLGVLFLLWKEKQPATVSSNPPAAEPQTSQAQPPPAPIVPRSAPIAQAPQQPAAAPPPGTTIAVPGGDPNAPIPAAPRELRVVRDHRNRVGEVPPPRKVSPAGMSAATAAILPAIQSCLPGPVTLQFTLAMSGGKARARDAKLMEATRYPEAQACVDKALASLSWTTPDGDGSTPVTLPLFGGSTSASGSKN